MSDDYNYQDWARKIVYDYAADKTPPSQPFWVDDLHVTSSVQTIADWKCGIVSPQQPTMYYEVIYDSSTKVAYLNVYTKVETVTRLAIP